jgi:hypothetical protein
VSHYQQELMRLVLDQAYAQQVAADPAALPADLDQRAVRRLVSIAADPGLHLTRTLHMGWRLSKLLTLLPMTCAAADRELLETEVLRFWREQPPRSLYFVDEAVRFVDHLIEAVGGSEPILADVARFEQAGLLLGDAARYGLPIEPVQVQLQHDPAQLLGRLAAGGPLAGVDERPGVLVGSVVDGEPVWSALA